MYTQKINNLRDVLRNVSKEMTRLRQAVNSLSQSDTICDDMMFAYERLDILYAQLTDKFTCLNILNFHM